MKKIAMSSLLILALISGVSSLKAQENQNTLAETFTPGTYTAYVVRQEGDAYTYGGIEEYAREISFVPYEENFKELKLTIDFGTSKQNYSYFPDENAFPATYIKGRFRGNAEMAKEFHSVQLDEKDRIVFLNNWIYVLKDWKDKDHYVIKECLQIGKYEGFKAVKESMASIKKMGSANHQETLQNYLNEAFKKQEELLPAWTAANQDLIKERELNAVKVEAAINGKNAEYWNSPEGQRKLAEMNQAKVTLTNDTGGEIYLCYGQGVSTTMKPGEKKEFSCTGGKIYRGTPRANSSQHDSTNKVVLDLNGTGCGQTIFASAAY